MSVKSKSIKESLYVSIVFIIWKWILIIKYRIDGIMRQLTFPQSGDVMETLLQKQKYPAHISIIFKDHQLLLASSEDAIRWCIAYKVTYVTMYLEGGLSQINREALIHSCIYKQNQFRIQLFINNIQVTHVLHPTLQLQFISKAHGLVNHLSHWDDILADSNVIIDTLKDPQEIDTALRKCILIMSV